MSKKLDNKREAFTEEYAKRLHRVQIECCDALRVIRSRDTADTFFYIDPPYVGSDQGHYDGSSWWHMFGWNTFGLILMGPAVATWRFFDTLNKIESRMNEDSRA